MLPTGVWVADIDDEIVDVDLPHRERYNYSDGASDFTTIVRRVPFEVRTLSDGDFFAELTSGRNLRGVFGYNVEIERQDVYGTLLVDTITFNIAAIDLNIETCPHVTVPFDELPPQVVSSTDDVSGLIVFVEESYATPTFSECE